MNITERIDAIKDLIKRREEIDRQLEALFNGGTVKARKQLSCSICGSDQHTARTCPQRTAASDSTKQSIPEPVKPFSLGMSMGEK